MDDDQQPSDPPGAGSDPRPTYRWAVFRRAAIATTGVAAVALAGAALYTVRTVLVEALVALFCAISLDPPVRWLNRHRVKRSHAVAAIFLTTLLLTAVFLWLFLPRLVREGTSLASDFPGYLNHLRQRSPALARLEDRYDVQRHLGPWIAGLPHRAEGNALAFGKQFMGAVASALLVAVLTIYFMLDLPRLRDSLVTLFPRRQRKHVDAMLVVVSDKVGSYMMGNFAISGIAGAAAFIHCHLIRARTRRNRLGISRLPDCASGPCGQRHGRRHQSDARNDLASRSHVGRAWIS